MSAPAFVPTDCVARWSIEASLPALDGHFPGQPVLPGALLLDWALATLVPAGAAPVRVRSAKFIAPVQPGCTLGLCVPGGHHGHHPAAARANFDIWRLDDAPTLVASGSLSWPAPTSERLAP